MKPENLMDSLTGTFTGFAAELDGIIDVDTISKDPRDTMMLCMSNFGVRMISCCDPKCGCVERDFKAHCPGCNIVEVKITKE